MIPRMYSDIFFIGRIKMVSNFVVILYNNEEYELRIRDINICVYRYNILPQIWFSVMQTPHSGYVTLCYFNHCQHKNHVTMVYHVIDSKLQPLFTTHTQTPRRVYDIATLA